MTAPLGVIIKAYREHENLSMEEFGNKCGLSKAYISMLEKNRDPRGSETSPRIETVARIAEAMGVDFDEFIESLSPEQRIVVNGKRAVPLQELLESGVDLTPAPAMPYMAKARRNSKIPQNDPIVNACITLFEQAPADVQHRILDYFDMEIAKRKLSR